MLQRVLIGSGVFAVAAILVMAVAVFDDNAPATSDTGALPGVTALDVEVLPDTGEAGVADPRARGVIIASLNGQFFAYAPDGEAGARPVQGPYEDGTSPDGAWQAMQFCPDAETCKLVILPAGASYQQEDIEAASVELGANFVEGQWARTGATFAALDQSGSLYLVEPDTLAARTVQACCVTAYAWTTDGDLLIGGAGKPGNFWVARAGLTDTIEQVASVSSPVDRFYESPDASQFAFAQSDAAGLRLMTIDTRNGDRLVDYGVLHEAVEAGGPQFAIAWSRDERYIAVGPVSAPYSLSVLDTVAGQLVSQYSFEEGYAGELVWSPVADSLAISTYSPDRLQHEVYVVDPASGDAPRHLLGGCRIVWSPDGRFIAAKAEPHDLGARAVDVETGVSWQIAAAPGLTPVAWGVDEATAIEHIRIPGRTAAVLGK